LVQNANRYRWSATKSGTVKVAFADSGILSRGINFTANSDTLEASLATSLGAFTISLWVNFSELTLSQIRLVELINAGGGHYLVGFIQAGANINFRFVVDGSQSSTPFNAFRDVGNLDSWHNIVITSDGSTGNVAYLDSVQLMTNSNTASSITGIEIGGSASGYDGRYDEMTIWNKQLSDTEVEELYNGDVFLDPTTHSCSDNLVSWWRFEDNANGTIVDSPDTTSTIQDRVSSNDLLLQDNNANGAEVAFVDAQSSWRIFNGQQTNVLSGLHFLTLEGDDAIELPVKCKEIYLTADGADVDLDVFASLTNIPSSRMFDLDLEDLSS
jgi:hypothetical protein